METTCQTPFGTLELRRWPLLDDDQHRAWDQADLLLLKSVEEQNLDSPLLILNDSFGALTTALGKHQPTLWSDSHISYLAASYNSEKNSGSFTFVDGADRPQKSYGLVLARVPKSLAQWQSQLCLMRECLEDGTSVLAAGMTKHLPHRALEIMRECLGPTERHQAIGKARILSAQFDSTLSPKSVPETKFSYEGLTFANHPNLFSRQKLDRGTGLLLKNLPTMSEACEALDLGCGNGILGTVFRKQNPQSRLTFVDVSHQAVASSRHNFTTNIPDANGTFLVGDGLEGYGGPKFDLVLFNPPFHDNYQVTDSVAWRLIKSTRNHMNRGGEIRLVGNRHLAYHAKLKRLFGNCEVVANDTKFVVLTSKY